MILKINRIIIGMLSIIFCSLVLANSGRELVHAATFEDAYTFYWEYGNNSIFIPESDSDGYIYYAVKGNLSDSKIKYRTLGWKISFYDLKKNKLQAIYYQLGGKYVKLVDNCVKEKNEYRLYAVSLSDFKKRLNAKVKSAMNQGQCELRLDACMIVVNDGKATGQMNDDGIVSGNVYTSYSGIVSAQNWSDEAKKALEYYFDKNVSNLFKHINVYIGEGVKSATGAGTYCYGTKVTLTATAKKGYTYTGWECGRLHAGSSYSFLATADMDWYTVTKPVSVKLVYNRNKSRDDSVKKEAEYYYGKIDQQLEACSWKRAGYHFAGWGLEQKSALPLHFSRGVIDWDWILDNSPRKELYAIWKINNYKIRFNGFLIQKIDDMNVTYKDIISMPGNGEFLGWSVSYGATRPDYRAGDEVSVKALSRLINVQYSDGAVIDLYAVWDVGPAISAGDLYYSLEAAKKGFITENELIAHAAAYDAMDGRMSFSKSGEALFYISDYADEVFTGLDAEAQIPIEYFAKNSRGITARKTVMVNVIDTSVESTIKNKRNIRFISKTYFLNDTGGYVDEKAGGLHKDSCWKQSELFTLLQAVLEA